jgi:sulfide:quinone oxidoreductase
VKQHVLILGAGFGGLELATRLSETLREAVRVTLLDRNDSFVFGFSKLELMLGRQTADDVRLHYRDIDKDGVEFRQETVTGVDPVARRVTTDAGAYDADFLVVAMGADYDMAATPGLEAGGFEYYTMAGAERLRDALAEFDGGRSSSPYSGSRSSVRRPRSRGRSCCTSTSRSGASASRCR